MKSIAQRIFKGDVDLCMIPGSTAEFSGSVNRFVSGNFMFLIAARPFRIGIEGTVLYSMTIRSAGVPIPLRNL